MSKFYNPKRSRNIFDPASKTPFKLSRSKIDNFLACPRCFYFDRRLGIGQPPGFPFNLNKAVDTLLKKEFDIHRAAGNPHPLMKTYKVDAIPYKNENMEKWRDALREGIQYFHELTNFIITGAIDDIWVNPKGELIIVDYKATSKTTEVTLDAEWQDGYKRQMEIYQWLFRKNDFKVNDTGYFVYCNGDADKEAFDGKLEFDIKLLPYKGDDSWIEAVILKAHKCLMSDEIPNMGSDCDFCTYRKAVGEVEK
ncbi:PD-(D/E)XK nuclease family protein [Patescibacteria group bacterium]|nr:PD-(D/E)XK nuclease family protein [Patescibacteria group bacterium]